MSTLRGLGPLTLLLLLALAAPAAAQRTVTIPRFAGRLTDAEASAVGALPYSPADVALAWLADDSLLVAHMEIYRAPDQVAGTCGGSGFFKVPVRGGRPRAVAVGEPACLATRSLPAASADGGSVVFGVNGSRDFRLARLDLRSLALDTLRTGCVNHRFPAVARNGRIAWSGCGVSDDGIWLAGADGEAARRLSAPEQIDTRYPAWSPDGATVLYGIGGSRRALAATDTLGSVRVLEASGDSPSWSPDGRWIAFLTRAEYPCLNAIRLVRPDGSDEREIFVNAVTTTFTVGQGRAREGQTCGPLVWSPDSKALVFPRYFVGGESVWRIDVASGGAAPITAPDGRAPR